MSAGYQWPTWAGSLRARARPSVALSSSVDEMMTQLCVPRGVVKRRRPRDRYVLCALGGGLLLLSVRRTKAVHGSGGNNVDMSTPSRAEPARRLAKCICLYACSLASTREVASQAAGRNNGRLGGCRHKGTAERSESDTVVIV